MDLKKTKKPNTPSRSANTNASSMGANVTASSKPKKKMSPKTKARLCFSLFLLIFISFWTVPIIASVILVGVAVGMSHLPALDILKSGKYAYIIALVLGGLSFLFLSVMGASYFLLRMLLHITLMITYVKSSKQVELFDGPARAFNLRTDMAKHMFTLLDFFPEVARTKTRHQEALKLRGITNGSETAMQKCKLELITVIPRLKTARITKKRQNAIISDRGFDGIGKRQSL